MPDIDSTGTWLKTTIPGIIILGAAGSIVALLLLRLVRGFSQSCPI